MKSKLTQKNQSVDKFLKMIEFMSEYRSPMKLQDISKGIGVPASTVLRLLSAMVEMGYAYQDNENLKYALSMKFCKIGDSIKSGVSITEIVHPYLLDISNRSGENSYFAIEQDMTLVYLDVVEGINGKNNHLKRIGRIAPLHTTGIGKLLLLNYSDYRLAELEEKKGLERLTNKSITSIEALKEELQKISAQGYAIDNEECEIGNRCISVPLKDYTGTIVGGISISGPADRITIERKNEFLEILLPAAAEISKKLGY